MFKLLIFVYFLTSSSFYSSEQKNISKQFIKLIEEEKESLVVTTDCLLSKKIAAALLKAHQRGVFVELLIDTSHAKENSLVWSLVKEGVPVYLWTKKEKRLRHRFCIFHKQVLWQGPYTYSSKRQEGAFVLEDLELSEKLLIEFSKLKQESSLIAPFRE